jgi:hypothetical protein
MILAAVGALLGVKYKLAGGILQAAGGAAAAVYPLLYNGTPWLIPGGALLAIAGIVQVVQWWGEGEED